MRSTLKIALLMLVMFLSSFSQVSANQDEENGKNCSLQASITCKLQDSDIECGSITSNIDHCGALDTIYLVEYTFTYSNNNQAGDKVKFFPKYTTASAHGKEISDDDIGTSVKLKPGESKSYKVLKYIDACDFTMQKYEASIQMKGKIAKASYHPNNKCFAKASYSKQILRVTTDFDYYDR